jgi:hypothetical protein
MLKRSDSIKRFLEKFTHPDLAELYNPSMEVQVNVAQDGGQRIDGDYKGKKWQAWTDGEQTWKSFRMPLNANSEPQANDHDQKFDLVAHAEAIGMTGWDWESRLSLWVAYDFDAIAGHSEKHQKKLSEAELTTVRETVMNIPWVEVRHSTGGRGLHLYVKLAPVRTENHHEHAALARAILGKLSILTGYDFNSKVDVCGGNMWVWHRKMKGTDGLKLIKKGEVLTEPPMNWRDHLDFISAKKRKSVPGFIAESDKDDIEKLFDELSGQRSSVQLDEDHKKLVDWLERENAKWSWDQDSRILTCHTFDLKLAHEQLGLKGIFETMAKGTERGGDWNCLSGETKVITRQGVRTLRELAKIGHAELYVLTEDGYKWIDCPVRSFGEQATIRVVFGDYSNVRATLQHEWLMWNNKKVSPNKKFTCELKSGHYVPLAPMTLPEIDWQGYAHGFVYGDGWIERDMRNPSNPKITSCVTLFGRDTDLKELLTRYGSLGFEKVDGITHSAIRQMPADWKEIPSNPTREYALGFILGLISADGFSAKDSASINLFQSNITVINEIRDLAIHAGLRCNPVRLAGEGSYENSSPNYTFNVQSYNLTSDHFLRLDHKEYFKKRVKCESTSILDVDYSNPQLEEVFCAVVPKYHNFTLANGVVTGNCFCYPMKRGGWSVRRFTPGVAEAATWTQDGQGWTTCYYNVDPDLRTMARAREGIENPNKGGGFVFAEGYVAAEVAKSLGADLALPPWAHGRQVTLKEQKDGRLLAEMERKDNDSKDGLAGWLADKKLWKKLFNVRAAPPQEVESGNYDDSVRHLVTGEGGEIGWVLKIDGGWQDKDKSNVATYLAGALELEGKAVTKVLGACIARPWTIVNEPFKAELVGDRKWNRNPASFRFVPSKDKEGLKYPTFSRILNHCGKGLDESVKDHPWCKANGIVTGGDYLKCWIASLFQEPYAPLPYLFFYSEAQATGKSTFHEAIKLLMTKGVARADNCLINQSGFNGELEGAVLCVIEETDLRKNKMAYNRIKDWVTSPTIQIHPKNGTPYSSPNTAHFIQCSNDRNYCPSFAGDTRITVIEVPQLEPIDMMTNKQLIPLLEKEAPDFIAELLSLELPVSPERLNIPVIVTPEKQALETSNLSYLEMFIREQCFKVTGATISYGEFHKALIEWLPPDQRDEWGIIRVGKNLPKAHPKGRLKDASWYVANLAWEPREPEAAVLPELVLKGDKLVPKT